jgi:hypothetical protein
MNNTNFFTVISLEKCLVLRLYTNKLDMLLLDVDILPSNSQLRSE